MTVDGVLPIQPSKPKLLFIGGCPRSGTTLIQRILNSHSQVVGRGEFDFIPRIVEYATKMADSSETGRLTQYGPPEHFEELSAEYISKLLCSYKILKGTRWVSEKTPSNIFVFPQLLRLFADSKCILVVRDPRSTFSSLLEVNRRSIGRSQFGNSKVEIAQHMRKYYLQASALLREDVVYSDRILLLRYEDLVGNPEPEIQRVCSFLGITYEPIMGSPPPHIPDGQIDGVWYTASMYSAQIEESRAHSWKSLLSPQDRALLTVGLEDSFKIFNYEMEQASILNRWWARFRCQSPLLRSLLVRVTRRLALIVMREVEGRI